MTLPGLWYSTGFGSEDGRVQMRTRWGRSSRVVDSKSRFPWAVLGTLALAGALLLALFLSRALGIRSLQGDLANLRDQHQETLAEQEELRLRLSLSDDPQTIEDLAREKLGLVHRGEEKVYFLED